MDVKKSHSSNSRDFIAEANSIIANIFHGIENKKEVQLNSTNELQWLSLFQFHN